MGKTDWAMACEAGRLSAHTLFARCVCDVAVDTVWVVGLGLGRLSITLLPMDPVPVHLLRAEGQ
jgi:hypothetical protein